MWVTGAGRLTALVATFIGTDKWFLEFYNILIYKLIFSEVSSFSIT